MTNSVAYNGSNSKINFGNKFWIQTEMKMYEQKFSIFRSSIFDNASIIEKIQIDYFEVFNLLIHIENGNVELLKKLNKCHENSGKC